MPLTLVPPESNKIVSATLLPPDERRIVTVMFADIIGSTPLADRLDPEDMRAILTGYFNLMTEQIRKHGGTVEKYIGDAVMAVFGVPTAHEDDPDRTIRAALDMQVALTLFNERRQTRLQMRIGINTGEVAAPNTALHQRQDFLITGDAVNVAARLQQAATPDTILVGERTYFTTRDVFDFLPIAPLHLKGKPEPIPAYVVQGLHKWTTTITQHPRGIKGHPVRLVGRALELTLLHANYARVQAERHPHLVTILGIPGIGKSRLVREFIAREQESVKSASSIGPVVAPKVLQGRCPPYGEGITYWPLVEILRSLLHVQDGESNDTLQQRFTQFVADTLGNSESAEEIANTILRSIGRGGLSHAVDEQSYTERPRQKRQRNTSTTLSGTHITSLRPWRVLLEALAQQQPLIIVVDDLQWANEALLDLLEYLIDRITTVPILFLCPARPDLFERRRDWGGGRRNFTTIELDVLSWEESSDFVDALLNTHDLPDVLRQTILTRAEGNPFFVEELVRMFIDQGLLVCEEDHEHGVACWQLGHLNEVMLSEPLNILPLSHIPDTIQGVLAARVDLLNPVEKLILQHSAVIGRIFWLSALLELAADVSPEVVTSVLASMIQRDFVVEDCGKQAYYATEHERAFSFKHILIRDVVYNTIPRMRRSQKHTHLALWLEERVTTSSESFVELLAYHYQQALSMWPTAHTIEAVPMRLTQAELRRRTITYLTLAGDQALHSYYAMRALQAYNDAFNILLDGEADPVTRITMHEKLGNAYAQRGSWDEAWQEYRKALQLATAKDAIAVPAHLPRLYERLAELGTRWLGGFDTPPTLHETRTYIDTGLQLSENTPTSRGRVAFLTYQVFWYIRQLESAAQKIVWIEQALASGHEALRLAEQLDHPAALSLALDALGFVYTEYHKYEEVHRIQQRRQHLEQQLTDREELYDLYISLGKVHEQIANYPAALMWFGRAWSNAQTMESPAMLIRSMVGRMRVWLEWNRWDEAQQVALEILKLIEHYQQDEKWQLWALETLATVAYRTGDQEQGDDYALQYKRLIDESTTKVSMHAIHLAREDWTRATADYQEKLHASEPLPSPEVLATLAELVVTTGEMKESQDTICERAVTQAEESGARKSLTIALRARGRTYMEQQNWSLALDDLHRSLSLCKVLDMPWEQGTTLYTLGLLYMYRARTYTESNGNRCNADLDRARYHFEQALGFFESVNAVPSIDRVHLALHLEHGQAAPLL